MSQSGYFITKKKKKRNSFVNEINLPFFVPHMDLQTFSVLLPAAKEGKERRNEIVFHWAVETRHYQGEGIIVLRHETSLVKTQRDHSSCVGKRRSDLLLTFCVRLVCGSCLIICLMSLPGVQSFTIQKSGFPFVTKTSFVWLNVITTSLFAMLRVNVDRLRQIGGKKHKHPSDAMFYSISVLFALTTRYL